jgi:hypothetical protein
LAGKTGGADRGGECGEDEVGDPVADAARATEGEDDEFVGGIGGDEAGYIGGEAVFEFGQGVGVGGFDERAVPLRARKFGVGGVIVRQAVSGGRVLAEEFELRQEVGGNSCEVLVVVCGKGEGKGNRKDHSDDWVLDRRTSTIKLNWCCSNRVNCTEQYGCCSYYGEHVWFYPKMLPSAASSCSNE